MKKRIVVLSLIIVLMVSAVFVGQRLHNINNDLSYVNTEDIDISENDYTSIQVELNDVNCDYSIDEKEAKVEIKEYTGSEDIVIIPTMIDGKQVKKINKDAFDECYNLEIIRIPKELKNVVEEIKYFKVNENTETGEYIEYITTKEYNEAYLNYMSLTKEEKAQYEVIPDKFYVPVEEVYSAEMKALYSKVATEDIPESFDLRDKIEIGVENQSEFGICYAYATLSAVETNLALTKGEVVDLSEIHLAVVSGQGNGGDFNTSVNTYFSTKQGPVYEEDWSKERIYDDTSIDLNININKYLKSSSHGLTSSQIQSMKTEMKKTKAVKYVLETIDMPSITSYMKEDESQLADVENIRNTVKKHIMNYGGLYASINMGGSNCIKYKGNMVMNNRFG